VKVQIKLQEKYWNLPAQQTLAIPGVTLIENTQKLCNYNMWSWHRNSRGKKKIQNM